jgi:hypothetical protein
MTQVMRNRQAERWAKVIARLQYFDFEVSAAKSAKSLRGIETIFRKFSMNGAIGAYYAGPPNHDPYFQGECDREAEAQQLIEDLTKKIDERRASLVPKRSAKPGHVYLVECAGLYKIGKSKQPATRLGRFATMWIKPTSVVAVGRCDDMVFTESQLHKTYAQKRVHGEWFALDSADIESIKAVLA